MQGLTFVSNLFPRPDDPDRATYNAQLLAALAPLLRDRGKQLSVIVPVASRHPLRFASIRAWACPEPWRERLGDHVTVTYLPHLYIPVLGRNLTWRFLAAALRSRVTNHEGHEAHEGCRTRSCRVRETEALPGKSNHEGHEAHEGETEALPGMANHEGHEAHEGSHHSSLVTRHLILASWLYPDAVAAWSVARAHNLPFLARAHGTDRFHADAPGRGRRTRRMLEDADAVIVNCTYMQEELQRRAASAIRVIPNGIDRERFSPRLRDDALSALPHALTASIGDRRVILYVGHLVPIKGPDRLLDAFIAYRQSHRDAAHLVMVGAGPLAAQLKTRVAQAELVDAVTFAGGQSHEAVAHWMNVADCLCLPSRSEGMPNVILESLSSGTPVVATAVGDVPNLIEDDVSGYVIPNDDSTVVDNLAKGLQMALQKSWDAAQIRESTSAHDWNQAAQALMRVVEQVQP